MRATRASQLILPASFTVWVIYGILAGMQHWPAAVLVGLVSVAILLPLEAALNIKIKLLDWVFLAYFVIAAIETFVLHSAAFPVYSSVVIWALYAIVTWASIFMGEPFSLQYARESIAPEYWSSPAFEHANLVISVVWGAAFVINILLAVVTLDPRYRLTLTASLAPLLTMAAATAFTSLYRRFLRQQMEQAAAD